MFGGQKSTFGSSGFGSSGGGGFGSSNTGGGLFGNTTNTSNTGGGLFGSSNTNNTNSFSFGSSNQQSNTGGGLFGSNTNTSNSGGLFGNTANNSAFGSNTNASSGFGSNTGGGGLFGATSNTNTNAGGMFGSGGFQSAQPQSGTQEKFEPFMSSDTTPKGGDIKTKLLCYSAMPKYQSKSLVELRIEDYMANRKAGSGGSSGGGMFGSSGNTNTTGGGLFGNTNTNTSSSGFGSGGNSLFGNNTNTSNSLFGGNNTNTSSSGGMFGNKPNGFGATNTGGGSLFGNTNTTQSNSGGLFGNTNTSNTGGGLFGNTNTSTNNSGGLFGNTNTSSGGFGATNTNTGGGLFGNNSTNTNSGGLFGNKPNTASGGLFGNNTATSTSGGGLFGNTSTSTSSGGLFGNNANKPATGGGLFGNTNNTFGNNNQNKSGGGMFGNSGGFGTTNNTSGGLFANTNTNTNTSGGLFGNTQNKTGGGLFGNTSNTNTGGCLFGNTSTNNTGGGLFGNNTNNQTQQAQQSVPVPSVNADSAIAHLIQYPFGDSPLFRNHVLDKAKLEEQLKPVSPAAQKASLQPQYKVTANPTKSVLTPKAKSPNKSLFIGLEDDKDSSFSSTHLRPKQSVKKLTVKVNSSRKMSDSILFSKGGSDGAVSLPTTPRTSRLLETDSNSSKNDSTFIIREANSAPVQPNFNGTGLGGNLSNGSNLEVSVDPLRRDFKARLEDSSILDSARTTPISPEIPEENAEPQAPHPAGIVLRRPDYHTKPALDTLVPDGNGQCWVEKFTIVRRNYGQIYWPGKVNVANLNLDAIVDIKRKTVSVYPEEIEHLKPEQGEGLNQKAEVSLIATYPRDKRSNETVKDPERLENMGWPQKLESLTAKMGARFLDYDLATGTWSFRVQHFSKYGLADSDDEMDENETAGKIPVKPLGTLPLPKHNDKGDFITTQTGLSGGIGLGGGLGGGLGDDMDTTFEKKAPMEDVTNLMDSPREQNSFLPTADSLAGCQRIQDMKFSFFNSDRVDEPNQESTRTDIPPFRLLRNDLDQPLSKKSFLPTDITAIRAASPFSSTIIQSGTINRRSRCQLGPVPLENQFWSSKVRQLQTAIGSKLQKSNGWKCSWTRNGVSVHGGIPINISSSNKDEGILASASSRPKGFRLNLRKLGNQSQAMSQVEKENLSDVLDVLLKYSKISNDSSCPYIQVDTSQTQELIAAMNNLANAQVEENEISSEYLALQHEVSSLIVALWGTIELHGNPKITDRERKKRLKTWIKNSVGSTIKNELENEADLKKRLIILLSGGELSQARKIAMETGLEKLSVLIPLAGNEQVQLLIREQLKQWNDSKLDSTIDHSVFSVYQTLAGLNVSSYADKSNNVLNDSDWRRAFGFFLNFSTLSSEDISAALEEYKSAFESGFAAKPNPKYKEKVFTPIEGYFPDCQYNDICYSLVNIFCNGKKELMDCRFLVPESFSSDTIDYRLLFVTFYLIQSLDLSIPMTSLQLIVTSFAAQLERNGLWHYATAIQMLNPHAESREKSVREILARNVTLDEENEDREEFLTSIGLNPIWLHEMKAALAINKKEYKSAVKHLIDGKFYNRAHNIIFDHLVSRWITDGRTDELREMLQELDEEGKIRKIEDWEGKGSVLVDYFEIKFMIENIQKKAEEGELNDIMKVELDEMEPVLAGLVSRIGGLNGKKAIDALARAELARGALHWWEVRQAILRRDSDLEQLESLVKSARLPEDYALDSLRRAAMRSLISN